MASDHQPILLPAPVEDNWPQMRKKRNRKGERVKVTRACDGCKKRKIKCNGTQPCAFCHRTNASCTFTSAYARGRVPAILSVSGVDNGRNLAPAEDENIPITGPIVSRPQYPTLLPRTEPRGDNPTELQNQYVSSCAMAPSASTDADAISQTSPEPSQTDLQGHYIGPASGVSFLHRIQKRLHQASSFSQASSIFTFGDATLHLPESDPSFCMMLHREDAQRLIERYFDFAMPTYRFLHRPTIQQWFNEFYDTLGIMHDVQNAPAKVALLFMVFAHARIYMPDDDRPGPPDMSTRYFLAAEHQLTKEKGSIRLTSVQARLTQCYYLLAQSRVNHCWSLFGTVAHLALAIGLNRNIPPDAASRLNIVEAEGRRRTFWCAYTLDTYLSAALGRPRTFHDDDIDTELPACVEDEDLVSEDMNMQMTSTRGPSTMLAALAHMKLAQIISKILSNLYSIKPIPAARRIAAMKEISKDLSNWRAELARFLDVDNFSTSFLIPLFQRQRNVLNLTYWHAVILLHRPFVLSSLSQISQQNKRNAAYKDAPTDESLKECLDAAMKTVNTINEITESHQLFRAFWITTYFAFNATIMLYIYVIQERASPSEIYSRYFSAATRCQSHISSIAEKGSLSERYYLVLEELRIEALRQTKSIRPSTGILDGMDSQSQSNWLQPEVVPTDENRPTPAYYTDLMEGPMIDFNSNVPGFSFSDCLGWDQFTSMVSSGLGNMDVFINHN
ncbi:hypothetical protein N7510_005125 [Penicillium lagena]|uniref:uncharacterized protein n=1 Tax=Penicillium lagena TaxID=94218 RepID=UPI00253F6F4E|nr:uncharacterized protein N7510_005125 [Penicillium lagena]KAJ5621141.1 hypothetical protein N7510_005125 [Penicillium lagena]